MEAPESLSENKVNNINDDNAEDFKGIAFFCVATFKKLKGQMRIYPKNLLI